MKRVQRSRLLRGDEMLRTQRRRVSFLVARRAENRYIRTHRSRQLHRHVAQTAQTDDGDLVAWLAPELAKRRICGYASAHQRSSLSRVQHFRDTQHITLINNNVCRVASVGPRLRVLVEAVKRERHTLLTEHLVARPALRADAARIDEAAHPDQLAVPEARSSCPT